MKWPFGLEQYYYRPQSQIRNENITPKTRYFLSGKTDVDTSEMLQGMGQATHRDAIGTDLQAFQEAGVRGTPTFFPMKEGGFVTRIVGPQSDEVFKNSLGTEGGADRNFSAADRGPCLPSEMYPPRYPTSAFRSWRTLIVHSRIYTQRTRLSANDRPVSGWNVVVSTRRSTAGAHQWIPAWRSMASRVVSRLLHLI